MNRLEQRCILPGPIMGLIGAVRASQALQAAVKLKIFPALAERENSSSDQIAGSIKADRKGTELLLDALVSLRLIEKSGGTYKLTDIARQYLLPESHLSLIKYMEQNEQLRKSWEKLPEAIASGKPVVEVNQDESAEQFFPALAEAIFPSGYAIGSVVAGSLSAINQSQVKILDVAAGSGAWSIPFAERNEQARVVALDFPAVLEVTGKIAARHKVAEQYSYLSGNWRDVTWEKEAFDIVILGHILHSEGVKVSRQLLESCHGALKKGGRLVIAEFLSNDEKTGSPPAMLFALNMFLLTTEGCVFTQSELQSLVEEAGFSSYKVEFDEEYSCTVVSAVKR